MIYLVLAIIAIGLAIGVRVLEWKVWWKKFDANPRNFPFHHKGRVLWHSRSVAVAAFTFCKNSLGEWCVLANQRGKGAADYNYYWNVACGFLDFSETAQHAAKRETLEETSIDLSDDMFQFHSVQSDPKKSNQQNVTIRYFVKIEDKTTDDFKFGELKGGEKNEVNDIRWIPISTLKEYNWAFGHKGTIEKIVDEKIVK